jgi:DUF4097 and DUF4098 domain-containing protein YvlB
MSIETFENTFEVKAPARLRVSNVRGHVDVQPGEEGIISVTAVKHQGSGSNGKTQIFVGQESDGLVVAEAKYENSITNLFGMIKPSKVDFTIRVPQACSVKINCVSSSATICGLEGDFEVQGVSGDINLANLNGNFNFSNVSGKIAAKHLDGPLEMNNVSGKVQITESQIPKMIGKTVSGSATIETPLTDGPYEFKSVSGNMSVVTPEDTSCTVYIKSVSGKAKINLPVTGRSGIHNKQVIEVAGGGPEISMKSVSGILKVGSPNYVKSDESQLKEGAVFSPAVVKPTNPAPQPKSQMQILQEIENGEISVDEALELMNP